MPILLGLLYHLFQRFSLTIKLKTVFRDHKVVKANRRVEFQSDEFIDQGDLVVANTNNLVFVSEISVKIFFPQFLLKMLRHLQLNCTYIH